MERCPVCRARLKDRQICHRCGADLTLAIEIEKKADVFFKKAIICLEGSDFIAAKMTIKNALLLHNKPIYQQFLGFVESLTEDVQ